MTATTNQYVELVTSEHRQKPDFIATVETLVAGFVDGQNVLATIPPAFNLDTAVGEQLDQIGLWIGFPRTIAIPIQPNLFQFDVAGSGFNEGVWQGVTNPLAGLVVLSDALYRTMLRIKAGANSWDGSLEQMYAILTSVFATAPTDTVLAIETGGITLALDLLGSELLIEGAASFFIIDNQDMTAGVFFVGNIPDTILLSLFENGYMPIKPEGVRMDYWMPSAGPTYFGFDMNTGVIQGFDQGSWPTHI